MAALGSHGQRRPLIGVSVPVGKASVRVGVDHGDPMAAGGKIHGQDRGERRLPAPTLGRRDRQDTAHSDSIRLTWSICIITVFGGNPVKVSLDGNGWSLPVNCVAPLSARRKAYPYFSTDGEG